MIMSDHGNHMFGQRLPNINTIKERLFPCSRPGCTTYASNQEELFRHEQNCQYQTSPDSGRLRADFAVPRVQMNDRVLSRGYRLQTQFEGHSSASPVDGDSDGSSIIMTPVVSRAPSLCPYPTDRRQSGVIRTEKGRGRKRTSTTEDLDGSIEQFQDDVAKRTKKMNKEKHNRSQHAAVIQRFEDAMSCYAGWSKHEQSGGNGSSAGLQASKITNLLAMERLSYKLLDDGLKAAMKEGRVLQWKTEICDLMEYTSAPDYDPYAGTLLDGEEVACFHKDKGKPCEVHHHPDWRECRRSHSEARFQQNLDDLVAQMGEMNPFGTRAVPSRPATSSSRRY